MVSNSFVILVLLAVSSLLPGLSIDGVQALMDAEYKACWDIELQDDKMFCYGAVSYSQGVMQLNIGTLGYRRG